MQELKTSVKIQKYREKFDIVTARAVARLSVLSELCVPLVKKGGLFISMKGAAADDELVDAKKSLSVLGAKLKEEHSFILPEENSERNIFVFNKIKNTPKKYPRKPGIPNKSTNSIKCFTWNNDKEGILLYRSCRIST